MKTKNILLRVIYSCLIMTSVVYGQEKEISVNKNLFKINLLTPGITYELGLGNRMTLNSDLNLTVTYFKGSESPLKFFPFIREQLRYYYNIEKRTSKNKNTINNSGNFFALHGSYYFNSVQDSNYVHALDGATIAPVWGLQRTYQNNLNISINAGLGYNFSSNDNVNELSPIVNFTLGWVIGK